MKNRPKRLWFGLARTTVMFSMVSTARGFGQHQVRFLSPFRRFTRENRYACLVGTSCQRWMASEKAEIGTEMDSTDTTPMPMENLYREWSLDQDRLLWSNKDKSTPELAAILGRGIRGVEARLSKLQDVSSPAYERLFAKGKNDGDTDDSISGGKEKKLVPVGEVMQRIEWDYMLQASDFSILHYDRVDDSIVESNMAEPNNSIAGKETLLAKALPEHRIMGIKYKERVIWDRQAKIDLMFGSPGIYDIVETYDDWKAERERVEAWNRERQQMVARRIRSILGFEAYANLQELSSNLLDTEYDPTVSTKAEVESYIQQALQLFRQSRKDPSQSLEPGLIPTSDYLALDELSELVAVLPNAELRGLLLEEISQGMRRAEGKGKQAESTASKARVDVKVLEDEITETFVRGSGPGGQKINKTSNRVILVHEPTQLRVECQDTRSLQNNRKIARKRLKEKLDEYLNGKQSKLGMKQQKASSKKQKSKSKNRARQRKKQQEKEQLQQQQQPSKEEKEDEWDFY